MQTKKLYGSLKIILIILLVVLMYFILNFKTNDCAYCKFEVEGNKYNAAKFMSLYNEVCFEQNELDILNRTIINNYS